MVFLSFASEFNFSRAVRHLFATGTARHSSALKTALLERYQGLDAALYHNGRTALAEGLRALVPKGTKVAINGLTCSAVPQAVKAAGCMPVFVDINRQDFNFDIPSLTKALEADASIGAIIIQNHLGLTADLGAIQKLAKQHQCLIIEDLAHCAGSHYASGQEVGTIGDAVALSFGKGKAIDTTSGGALVLRTPAQHPLDTKKQHAPRLSDRLRDRFYPILGWKIRVTYRSGLGKAIARLALKTRAIVRSSDGDADPAVRLTHWQARLALRQFKNLNRTARTRRTYAARYGFPDTAAILRIPVLVKQRDTMLAQLAKKGFQLADSWYEVPVSPARTFKKSSYPTSQCPTAVAVASEMLNLPLLPKSHLRPALEILSLESNSKSGSVVK